MLTPSDILEEPQRPFSFVDTFQAAAYKLLRCAMVNFPGLVSTLVVEPLRAIDTSSLAASASVIDVHIALSLLGGFHEVSLSCVCVMSDVCALLSSAPLESRELSCDDSSSRLSIPNPRCC